MMDISTLIRTMKPLLFFAVFVIVVANIGVQTSEFAEELIELCPFSRFCTRESLKKLPHRMVPCCGYCSCEKNCHVIGSCCPDVNHTVPSSFDSIADTEPVISCASQDQVYNIPRGFEPMLEDQEPRHLYRIIDTCLNNNGSCSDIYNIEDLVAVSDKDNEFVFKNKRCAHCSGFTDLIDWDLNILCIDLIFQTFTSMEHIAAFILQNCRVYSVPPGPDIGRLSKCVGQENIISSCTSSTKTSTLFDHDILLEEACLSTSMMYSYVNSFTGETRYYKNVFCYLCNVEPGITPRKACVDSLRTNPTSLLSFSGQIEQTRKDTNQPRCNDEFLDPFTNMCEELKCPGQTVQDGGTCVPFMRTNIEVGVEINLEVTFSDNFIAVSTWSEEAFVQMIKTAMTQDTECKICSVTVNWLKQTNASQLVRIIFDTSDRCSCHNIMDWARKRFDTREYRYEGHAITAIFTAKIMTTKVGPVARKVERVFSECAVAISLSGLLHLTDCPRLGKTVQDLALLGFNTSDIAEPDSMMGEPMRRESNNTDIILVCLDYYLIVGSFPVRSNETKHSAVRETFDIKVIIRCIPTIASVIIICIFTTLSLCSVRESDDSLNLDTHIILITTLLYGLSETLYTLIQFIVIPSPITRFVPTVLNYIWLLLCCLPTAFVVVTLVQCRMPLSQRVVIIALITSLFLPAPIVTVIELLYINDTGHALTWVIPSKITVLYVYAPHFVASVYLLNVTSTVVMGLVIRKKQNDTRRSVNIGNNTILILNFFIRFSLCTGFMWICGVVQGVFGFTEAVYPRALLSLVNGINIVYTYKTIMNHNGRRAFQAPTMSLT